MPEVISLFEHQTLPYREIPGFPADLAARERVLEQIEHINREAGLEILHLGRKDLLANALVGVLRAGDFTFEILPKIDWEGSGNAPQTSPRQSAVRNLLVMLSYASHIPIYDQATAALEEQINPWFELLTRLFALDLHRQVQAGLSQQYISQEDFLPVLRGRWNVQRQITRHGQTQHRFDVQYDVLSPDIPLNQVLRFVVDQLSGLTQDAENRALLGDITNLLRLVTLLPEINPALLEAIHFTRLNNRFQPSYQLARLFLSGRTVQMSAGHTPAHAFVLDMNVLFEHFVIAFIMRHRESILPPDWQSAVCIEQSAGFPLFLGHSQGKPVLRLKPDLIVSLKKETIPLLIADMKYKRLAPGDRRLGASQADIYQMLAYGLQSGCSRSLLLYPQTAGSAPVRRKLTIDRVGMQMLLTSLNLRIPLLPPEPLIQELGEIFKLISV